MIRICAISDLHGYLPDDIEESDLLLIAGDISPLKYQSNLPSMESWLKERFIPWLEKQPVQKVVFVAGNHDFWFLSQYMKVQKFFDDNVTKKDFIYYLLNETMVLELNNDSWTIFGTPYCRVFGNWPFMLPDPMLKIEFNKIPSEVDIIISHDPPFALGDADVIFESFDISHKGNKPLADKLKSVQYSLLVCGHIHSGDHNFNPDFNTVNVSLLNEQCKPSFKPFYTELSK